MKESPKAFLVEQPTKQSLMFAGKYINLLEIAKTHNLDHSYLSRIFSGKRLPTIPHARVIAEALQMSIGGFLDALQEHVEAKAKAGEKVVLQYLERVAREEKEDLNTLRKGKIPAPRLPGLRAS